MEKKQMAFYKYNMKISSRHNCNQEINLKDVYITGDMGDFA